MNKQSGTSVLTQEQYGNLILTHMELNGGQATEESIIDFCRRCDSVTRLAAMITMAGDGKIMAGWSDELQDFIFKTKEAGQDEIG